MYKVLELRAKLAEREQEVAILVNMVKQAKAEHKGGGSMSRGSRGGSASGGGHSDDESETSSNGGNWAKRSEGVRSEAKSVQPPRPVAVPMVGGVKLTSEPTLLQDAEKVWYTALFIKYPTLSSILSLSLPSLFLSLISLPYLSFSLS